MLNPQLQPPLGFLGLVQSNPFDPVEYRSIDIHLPEQGVQLSPVLQFLFHEVPQYIPNRNHRVAVKWGNRLRDGERPLQVSFDEPVKEQIHLSLELVFEAGDLI